MRGRSWLASAALAAVLIAVAFFVFAPILHNAPVWDDADLTINNPFLRSFAGLARIVSTDIWTASAKGEPSSFYRPLAMISFFINRAAGNTSASYHFVNIALHATNAILIAMLVRKHMADARIVAIVVPALWFVVAPINSEAVAWISGRFDLLATMFVLAALVMNASALRFARVGVVAFLIAAILSKEAAIVIPVFLILQDVMVLRRPMRREAVKYAGSAIAILLFFIVRKQIGVMSLSALAVTGITRLVQSYAFLVVTFLYVLIDPAHLDPFRPYTPIPFGLALALVILLALIAFVLLARVRRMPDDIRNRAFAFGFLWFLIALAPASLTGPNLDMVGDRYAYFPLVGIFLVLAPFLDARWPRGVAPSIASSAVVAALLGAFAIRSVRRLADWKDERTLFNASVRGDPDNAYAIYSLGYLDALDHNYASADQRLALSLALKPKSWRTLNALCYVQLNEGNAREAERFCDRSLAINGGDPRTWINLASARIHQSKWQGAADAAAHAIQTKPSSAEAHYLRAVSLANLGDVPNARKELRIALSIDPDHKSSIDLLAQFHAQGIE
jgi:Flp pilus assembly protein TadD